MQRGKRLPSDRSTTLDGPGRGGSIHIHQLYDPLGDGQDLWPILDDGVPPISTLLGKRAKHTEGITMQYDLSGTRHASVWGAHVSSDHSNPTIAVATSRGVRCMYPTTNRNWAVDEDKDCSDVLAVRWLSPCLLMGGCRSGLVDLHDRRVPKKIKLLQHSSAVTGIRSIDEHRVVVAGMNHQVTLTIIKPIFVQIPN